MISNEMRSKRNCSAFSGLFEHDSLQEWFIYFSADHKEFSLGFVGPDNRYFGGGRYHSVRKMDINLQIAGLGDTVQLSLNPDPEAGFFTRFFCNARLLGLIQLGDRAAGECCVQKSHSNLDPFLRLKCKPIGCALEVYKLYHGLVVSPLVLHGMDSHEMILAEKGDLREKKYRQIVPPPVNGMTCVGSIRMIRYCSAPFEGILEMLALVVVLSELVIKEHYMRND